METSATAMKENEGSCSTNVFRDTPLRYLGYANEIGESFRYQLPRFVVPSYILASGYCFADAAFTGYRVYQEGHRDNDIQNTDTAIRSAADALLWQFLASVMVPGATINVIVKTSRFAIGRARPLALPLMFSSWFPTITGLGSIPFIVHPIDSSVDLLLDNTTRTWWKL